MKKTYRNRRIAVTGIITTLLIGAVAVTPTPAERTINKINKDINDRVLKLENIIEEVGTDFNKDTKELNVSVMINPIEEDIIRGKEAKDLILYQSKDLAKYTLKELNNIVSDKAGVQLKKANDGYFGELYDHYSTTIKVYRNDGYIYSYDILDNGNLRTLK